MTTAKNSTPSTATKAAKPTKKAQLIALLQRKSGMTIAEASTEVWLAAAHDTCSTHRTAQSRIRD